MRANLVSEMPSDTTIASTRIVIPAREISVRDGLATLFGRLPLSALSQDDRGTVEIVLAEALNNIVEHAYASYQGEIEVTLFLTNSELLCRIVDSGLPMPNGALPGGELKPHESFEDLPEGGFGWHLIRMLSKDLSYRREGAQNLLTFKLDTKQSQN
jgi:serine/threonine-protein kinase RsbW